jgi:redox-sensing transcriptional repressor
VLRLSRLHCFLGELMGVRSSRRVTSREIAEELGLSEETVRRDLQYVDVQGRPGSGYDLRELHSALQAYLELSEAHPILVVGNADILRGLTVTFPASQYGLHAVGYLSERQDDVGVEIDGLKIGDLADAPRIVAALGVSVAIVACQPDHAETVLDALAAAGIGGALMLTPVIRPYRPDGMDVTYFRMPCALKALASAQVAAPPTASCCSGADE